MNARELLKVFGPLVGIFAVAVDGVGVIVALPAIQADLDAPFSTLQWTISAYMLAIAAAVVTVGRMGDVFGRRRVFIIGFVVFAIGGAVAGLAPNEVVLILGRVLQGLGGAALYSLSLALVTAGVPKEEVGRGVANWAIAAGLGMAAGPLIDGLLVDSTTWRAVFLIYVPIGIVGIAMTRAYLEESTDPDASRRIDVPGIALIAIGVGMLLLGLIQANAWGWSSPAILILLFGSLIPLVAFVWVERRAIEPIVDVEIFGKNRDFLVANGAGVGQYFTVYAFVFVVAIYLQDIQSYSAIEAGIRMIPWPLTFALLSPHVGRLIKRIGPVVPMAAGSLIMAGSSLGLAFAGADTGEFALFFIFVSLGVGQALGMVAVSAAALGAVPPAKFGVAAGIRSTMAYISGSLGVAVVGAVLLVREQARLGEITEELGRRLTRDERNEIDGLLAGSDDAKERLGDFAPLNQDQITDAAGSAFTAGMQASMFVCAGVLLLGAALVIWIHRPAKFRIPLPLAHFGHGPPHEDEADDESREPLVATRS